MKIIDDFKSLVASARSEATAAASKLRGVAAKLHARLADRAEEKTRLFRRPAPKAERDANIHALVASAGAEWLAAYGPDLVEKVSGRLSQDYGPTSGEIHAPRFPDSLGGFWTSGALSAVIGQALESGLVALCDAAATEPGIPMANRVARLVEIEEEIQGIEAELVTLADAAVAAGVGGIPLPAGEQGRRIQQQDRAARARNDEAMDQATYGRFGRVAKPVEPK